MAMAKALEKARLAAASIASAAASIAAIARGRRVPSSEPRRVPFPKRLKRGGGVRVRALSLDLSPRRAWPSLA